MLPAIDANQRTRFDHIAGFFQRLAHDGLEQALSRLEMPGWLIETQAFVGFFFNQQEPAFALDDGGYGDVGFPDFAHDILGVPEDDSPEARLNFAAGEKKKAEPQPCLSLKLP